MTDILKDLNAGDNVDKIARMTGKTLSAVDVSIGNRSDAIKLTFCDGTWCRLYHKKAEFERVVIDDIDGSFCDMIGWMIRSATEDVTFGGGEFCASYTYTRYRFENDQDWVEVVWCGDGEGYSSERPSVEWGRVDD